jgi:folate-dependent phosphoribosylglycinamide formyltransferase PurN
LGRRPRPLRVAVFASGGGGNLRAVIRLAVHRPELVAVAAMVTDRPSCAAVGIADAARVPVIARDFDAECGRASDCHSESQRRDYAQRAEAFHDRIDAELLSLEGANGALDMIVLSYGRWIHGRLLNRFAGRMINQHPGDLTQLDNGGRRTLIGNDPVLAALLKGARRVRTSTFFVDAGRDSGPILCQGPAIATAGTTAERNGADRLEQTLKRESDWPSVVCAVTLIAVGAVSVDAGRRLEDGSSGIAIAGVPMPLGGFTLMDDLHHPDPRLRTVSEEVRASLECLHDGAPTEDLAQR